MACRNFPYHTGDPLDEHPQLVHCCAPLMPPDPNCDGLVAPTGPTSTPKNEDARLLTPQAHMLDQVVSDLERSPRDAVLFASLWEHTAWFSRARRLRAEYNVMRSVERPDYMSKQWAKVAFLFTQVSSPPQASKKHEKDWNPAQANRLTPHPATLAPAVTRHLTGRATRAHPAYSCHIGGALFLFVIVMRMNAQDRTDVHPTRTWLPHRQLGRVPHLTDQRVAHLVRPSQI